MHAVVVGVCIEDDTSSCPSLVWRLDHGNGGRTDLAGSVVDGEGQVAARHRRSHAHAGEHASDEVGRSAGKAAGAAEGDGAVEAGGGGVRGILRGEGDAGDGRANCLRRGDRGNHEGCDRSGAAGACGANADVVDIGRRGGSNETKSEVQAEGGTVGGFTRGVGEADGSVEAVTGRIARDPLELGAASSAVVTRSEGDQSSVVGETGLHPRRAAVVVPSIPDDIEAHCIGPACGQDADLACSGSNGRVGVAEGVGLAANRIGEIGTAVLRFINESVQIGFESNGRTHPEAGVGLLAGVCQRVSGDVRGGATKNVGSGLEVVGEHKVSGRRHFRGEGPGAVDENARIAVAGEVVDGCVRDLDGVVLALEQIGGGIDGKSITGDCDLAVGQRDDHLRPVGKVLERDVAGADGYGLAESGREVGAGNHVACSIRWVRGEDRRGGRVRRGSGEAPGRFVRDTGVAVAGEVVDGGVGDLDGVVLVWHEVRCRVDGQDRTGDRDLIRVRDRDGRLRRVAQVLERNNARAKGYSFAEGCYEVRADGDAGSVVRRIEGGDGGCNGVGSHGGEIPRRVVGDPGEGVVGQVLDRSRSNPNRVVLAAGEVRRRVDRQDRPGDRDLGRVGDWYRDRGSIGQVPERDVAGAPRDVLAEGRHEVRSDRHARGAIRRAEGGDRRRAGVGSRGREVPRRVAVDPGEVVVCQVLDRGRSDPDGEVLADRKIRGRVRVDGHYPAGNRDLAGVGDGDGRLRPVGQVRERDVAGAPHNGFAEGRHEVRTDSHAGGIIRRAEGDDLWRDGVSGVDVRIDHIGRLVIWIQFRSGTAFNRWIRIRYEFDFHHEISPAIDRQDLVLICPVDIRAEGHVARVAHGIGPVAQPGWINKTVRPHGEAIKPYRGVG